MDERLLEFAHRMLRLHHGLDCSLKQLASYDDINIAAKSTEGAFVLKFLSTPQDWAFVEAEARILQGITGDPQNGLSDMVPSPRPALDGRLVVPVQLPDGRESRMLLLSFLEGTFMGDIVRDEAMYRSLGRALGKLDRAMAQVDEPAIGARRFRWDLHYLQMSRPYLHCVKEPARRRLVDHFIKQFETEVLPQLPLLPRQCLHNDANEWNTLTENGLVSGFIDFGDMVMGPRVLELGVSLAYALMEQEDPVQAAAWAIEGYVETYSLDAREVPLLFWMIAGRLCTTLLSSAEKKADGTATDYILISEQGAWDLLEHWIRICPDHATRTWLAAAGHPVTGTGREQLLEKRHSIFSSSMSLSYQEPIQMERAALQYMYGADGRSYLDCVNNIMHVGHCHPRVVEAIQRQAARLNTNTRYLYHLLSDYAERLLQHFPDKMQRVFFVNSGSAAGDLALRIARTATGCEETAVLKHGYHGNTASTIAVSNYKYAGKGGPGKPNGIWELPLAGPLQNGALPERLGAFIHESIVGCGGQVVLAGEYMQGVYGEVRKRGGVCIADEVQTGFGRVGHGFWAYELLGLDPDIVVMGKPMGNGHPLAAVVTTAELARGFETGMEFFSSFGGNPVSCAAGMAVLDVIESEGLQGHARDLGDHLMREWKGLEKEFAEVENVRGSGLFLGMELVVGDGSGQANGGLAKGLVNAMRKEGFLLSTDGPANNVIKFKPPMCFDWGNAKELTQILKNTLHELI